MGGVSLEHADRSGGACRLLAADLARFGRLSPLRRHLGWRRHLADRDRHVAGDRCLTSAWYSMRARPLSNSSGLREHVPARRPPPAGTFRLLGAPAPSG